MSKKELAEQIAEKFTDVLSKTHAKEITNFVFDNIKNALVAGKKVSISGFGKFYVIEKPERDRRNPTTGEKIRISASKSAKFKAGKQLITNLNNN
ncbi:DNA-binding protein HU-beta [Spiroplasma kunkelii CR2-3x]|uniref:DNA-binding protein HU-beta n=1 Tax=Spiroplasma kunkelii CR2-3x TaxID=273035 RepID=A0A0K2JFJ4_SPIKU|nr:HU family DNA-binding protein [Spiroplasma kunkelii]ALA97349.1 DNA-binding protein HU-beta [Spiroplasma kunkelii CR2-3x]